eukprot:PhM_4_TR4683/c0_g1_i1/m.55545
MMQDTVVVVGDDNNEDVTSRLCRDKLREYLYELLYNNNNSTSNSDAETTPPPPPSTSALYALDAVSAVEAINEGLGRMIVDDFLFTKQKLALQYDDACVAQLQHRCWVVASQWGADEDPEALRSRLVSLPEYVTCAMSMERGKALSKKIVDGVVANAAKRRKIS